MITLLSENWGSMLVALVILGIAAAIIVKIVRDKRKGKCVGCDCGCGNCPKSDKALIA